MVSDLNPAGGVTSVETTVSDLDGFSLIFYLWATILSDLIGQGFVGDGSGQFCFVFGGSGRIWSVSHFFGRIT